MQKEVDKYKLSAENDDCCQKFAKTEYEIEGEFKEARYAKEKIAFHPRKGEPNAWKTREHVLAEAKGVSGKWSNREKAYIMSKGQAERLKRYIVEGYDACAITGEIILPE